MTVMIGLSAVMVALEDGEPVEAELTLGGATFRLLANPMRGEGDSPVGAVATLIAGGTTKKAAISSMKTLVWRDSGRKRGFSGLKKGPSPFFFSLWRGFIARPCALPAYAAISMYST